MHAHQLPPMSTKGELILARACSSTMAAPVLVLQVAFWCSVLVAACSMAAEGRLPGCRDGHGSCLDQIGHSSPSDINESKMIGHGATDGEANGRLRPSEMVVDGSSAAGRAELRWAPSGPDPLHHNGGSPKKPQIPN